MFWVADVGIKMFIISYAKAVTNQLAKQSQQIALALSIPRILSGSRVFIIFFVMGIQTEGRCKIAIKSAANNRVRRTTEP